MKHICPYPGGQGQYCKGGWQPNAHAVNEGGPNRATQAIITFILFMFFSLLFCFYAWRCLFNVFGTIQRLNKNNHPKNS